jgi:hypothetical protein
MGIDYLKLSLNLQSKQVWCSIHAQSTSDYLQQWFLSFFSDGTLKLCNMIAGTPMICKFFSVMMDIPFLSSCNFKNCVV